MVVALTGGPEGKTLIRRAARIAARSSGGDLLAVHVTKSDGLTGADPAALAAQRRLVESVGGTYHQVVGDDIPEALLTFARAENATQLVLGASRRSWLTALLTGPGIGSRTIRGSGDIDVHIVTHAQMGRGRGLPRARGAITPRRKLTGYVLAAALTPALTLLLTGVRNGLNLTSDVLVFLVAVIWSRWSAGSPRPCSPPSSALCCSTTTSSRPSTGGQSPRRTTPSRSAFSSSSRCWLAGWSTSRPGGPRRRRGPTRNQSC